MYCCHFLLLFPALIANMHNVTITSASFFIHSVNVVLPKLRIQRQDYFQACCEEVTGCDEACSSVMNQCYFRDHGPFTLYYNEFI